MDISSKKEFDLYKDIQNRTDGEVFENILPYLGIEQEVVEFSNE